MSRPPAESAARGLGDGARRLVEEVQHLMDDDEVEAVAHDRQVHDVAEPDARIVDRGALKIGARDGKHRRREVDAERALVAAGEKLQHAAGAGADIEHGAEGPLPGALKHRRLDLPLRHMQRADGVPAAGMLGEIALGGVAVLLLQGREALAVALQPRVARIELLHDRERHGAVGVIVGKPIIDPRAFRAARDEARLGEHLQMARDARLRLAENLGQLLHRALAALKQREQADARLVARGFHLVDDVVDGESHAPGPARTI